MNLRSVSQLGLATVLFALIGLVASCTDDSAAINDALSVNATAMAQPTRAPLPTPEPTVPPTATPQPTTTPTPNLTPEALQDLEAIREVHTRFMTELFAVDERTEGAVSAFSQLVSQLTTGEQTDLMLERLEHRQADSEFLVGHGYESNIVALALSDDGRVRISDCSFDTGMILDASDTRVESSSPDWKIRETVLTKVRGGWRVSAFFTGGDMPCDPSGL